MNIAVLGAGVTGLACATTLQDAGEAVTVYESESQPGGLARTEVVNGFVFDCSGGHIFNTRWPDVKEWFFRYLPESEWQYNIRSCKVWYRKELIIDYPFELGLHKLPLDEAVDCLIDLFNQQTKQEPEPDNLRDWFIWRFGRAIAERYLIPYNRKLWDLNPALLSPIWVQGKMPLPSIREILKATLRKDSSENKTAHSSFYYPKKGGIQNWVNRVAATVPNLRLSTKVESVEKVPAGWRVNGGGIYNRLVSTIPLPEIGKALGKVVPPKVQDTMSKLRYNSWTATYYDYDITKPIGEFFSWIYISDPKIHSNKFSNYSCFAPQNAPKGHSNLLVDNVGICDSKFVTKDARKILSDLGEPLATYHTKYAYVVYDQNYLESVKIIRDWCENYGIILLGRFGRWEYPNMDVCVRQVFDWAKSAGIKR